MVAANASGAPSGYKQSPLYIAVRAKPVPIGFRWGCRTLIPLQKQVVRFPIFPMVRGARGSATGILGGWRRHREIAGTSHLCVVLEAELVNRAPATGDTAV